MVMNYQN